MTTDHEALVKRLEETIPAVDGYGAVRAVPRNPDGMEAAAAITNLTALVREAEQALRGLELANDRVCGARPQNVYLAMIDAGMGDALSALDDARLYARQALAKLKEFS